ncbi:PLP-dependent aminotransferase family protein [Sphingopyxis sp.]|uniref:MocR-like pyridoxine biosynthesis transcription factor PdxR n=1 Tax=Sphingopyxis sp. TaxID=1908224 RepID=UPI003D6DA5B8
MLQNWHVGLRDRIDRTRREPLHFQIVNAIIHDIENGRLASGSYLPSSRSLASVLDLNRKTVVLVYEHLIAQGWFTSLGTRGTMVATTLPYVPGAVPRGEPAGDVGYSYSEPPARALSIPEGPGLRLDEGTPDGRLFRHNLLVKCYRSAAHRLARANGFKYRDPRGTASLRGAIADMLRSKRGMDVGEENICITRGSQNAIHLACHTLLRPGDTVIVEELTYEPAVAAMRALGAQVIAVSLDEDGIDVEDVAAACRLHRVRAVFVTPHHQFPTTVVMRPERRLRLVELARQHGFAIIEDDYDHEFHFESQPHLPIASYAPAQVIYVGSMSKLLLPTLRLGFAVAPRPVIDAVAHHVSLTDGMGNALEEEAVAHLIAKGELQRHVRNCRQIYAERRNHFARNLADLFGDLVQYRSPDGGLAFWLRFRTDIEKLEERASAAGLLFAPSQSYRQRESAPKGLRIGFASLDDVEQIAALRLLRSAVQ